jgi:CRP/FNR family transcriptional regulator, cyclic AMP receptor protein
MMSTERFIREDQIDKEEEIARVPLFDGLNKERIKALAAVSRVCAYPAGSEIIEEGAKVLDYDEDGMYLLLNGTVEVRKGSTDGSDGVLLATFGPGEFFGEMALLDGYPRSASVFATSEVLCLVLTRWDLHRQLRHDPEIAMKMLAALSHRLRAMDEAMAAREGAGG